MFKKKEIINYIAMFIIGLIIGLLIRFIIFPNSNQMKMYSLEDICGREVDGTTVVMCSLNTKSPKVIKVIRNYTETDSGYNEIYRVFNILYKDSEYDINLGCNYFIDDSIDEVLQFDNGKWTLLKQGEFMYHHNGIGACIEPSAIYKVNHIYMKDSDEVIGYLIDELKD